MAFDRKRCERLARAMASDSIAYMKNEIKKGFEEDNFFEVMAENMEENHKAFLARQGSEAAATNILECAIADTIVYGVGSQDKYPIF